MLIYYNTKMFEAAGIDRPSDDWTWDDFLAIANSSQPATAEQGLRLRPAVLQLRSHAVVLFQRHQ